ncbi:MAG: hypothetical protein P8107_12010 [Spirochaetia bacterium]
MDSTVIEEQNNTSHTRTEKQAAFPRVMELIIDKVRLLLERRLAWLGHLRGKEGEFQKFTVTNTEVSFILGNADNPQNQAAWFAGNPKAKTLTDKILQLENKIRMPAKNRYVQLVTMFGLQPAEENLLQVCLAVACIPSLRRVCSYLDHSGRAYITEELASQLTGMNRGPVMNPDTALSRFHLVLEEKIAPGEANLLKCDPQVYWWRGRTEAAAGPSARHYAMNWVCACWHSIHHPANRRRWKPSFPWPNVRRFFRAARSLFLATR